MKYSHVVRLALVYAAVAAIAVHGWAAAPPGDAELGKMRQWTTDAFAIPASANVPVKGLHVVRARNNVLVNRTPWNTPMRLGNATFDHGVYCDSAATVRVVLSQPGAVFTSTIGIDDNDNTRANPDKGSARFRVLADGVGRDVLFESAVLRLKDRGVPIRVPLGGAQSFLLEVDDGGDGIGWDQCDWGDAAVTYANDDTEFLDSFEFAQDGDQSVAPPFSFVYDGAASRYILAGWEHRAEDSDGDGYLLKTIAYRDPATGLEIVCEVKVYRSLPAVDWVCRLTNTGDKDTPIIEAFLPLDTTLVRAEKDAAPVLRWSQGDKNCPDAFLPHDEPLKAGEPRRFAPVGGRSSNHTFPFFNLQGAGHGTVLAIGWTGQWMAEFEPSESGQVRVRAGMEQTRFRLHPGESVRTPRIVLLRWEGDDPLRGHNLFRRLMIDHYVQRRDGQPAEPPIAHNTAATIYQTGQPTNEANQLRMVAQTADRNCEAFWLDAYWYPQPWHEHVGDWFPRPEDFPRGLRPIADAAHERGMKFILWFEPERVRPGTRWASEHPEYLLTREGNDNALMDLGNPEAREFVTDFLDGRIKEWSVDVYRQDFNRDPLEHWRNHDADDRQGITEMKYIEGLYRMWDELMARNPGLTIDNCSSGGRRIDVETCARSWPMWRSDYNDIGEGLKGRDYYPYMGRADQVHGAGLSLYIPFQTGSVWSDEPYVWRSAMASGIVLYGDITKFSAEDIPKAVAELRELRPFYLGDFYPLTEITLSQRHWHAYQLDRPDMGAGCALFFRRPDSPYPACSVALQGIDADADYEVSITGETYEPAPAAPISGGELQSLTVTIAEKPASALLRYRRIP